MATAAQFPPQVYGDPSGTIGKSQRLFQQDSDIKVEEMMSSGQCQPYIVMNFNPVALDLTGALRRFRVPSPDDDGLPKSVCRASLRFEGKLRTGHYLLIDKPMKDSRVIDAKPLDNNMSVPIVSREVRLFPPKEIAYSFVERYSPVFVAQSIHGVVQPAAPRDARRIFGILAFEGDIHTLERVLDEDDPAKRLITVPICHMTTIGDTVRRTIRTVQYPLDKYLEQMFAGQRRYADVVITRAQQKFSSGLDEEIKNISDSDRVWYRWAIAMGFAQPPKPGEKTWLTEYMTLRGPEEATVDSRLRKCQACRALEPEPDTPFCPRCAAPINTFQTYMSGYPVADMWLQALKGDEREAALAEMKLRRQGFGDEPKEAKPRGAYKGKGKVDPAEEIPAAETTALDGEE